MDTAQAAKLSDTKTIEATSVVKLAQKKAATFYSLHINFLLDQFLYRFNEIL